MTDAFQIVQRRQQQWRVVGKAYDTACEVARVVPRDSRVLDVGCGEGFVAHHLTALLRTNVIGIDLASSADAPIEYLSYDGKRFPVKDQSFDGVLLAYVLHHAQDAQLQACAAVACQQGDVRRDHRHHQQQRVQPQRAWALVHAPLRVIFTSQTISISQF